MSKPGAHRFRRRELLVGALATAATPWSSRRAYGAGIGGAGNDVLVYVFLRGGIDGLSVCVPYGDPYLAAARPTLALPPPGAPGGTLDLDGFFGLNPKASPLLPLYQSGDLAFVHAMGSTDPTRSHFLAFQQMEFGIPNQPLNAAGEGWLSRHMQSSPSAAGGPLRCAVLSEVTPLSLAGAPKTLPIPNVESFDFPGDPLTAAARSELLRDMYAAQPAPMGPAASDTVDTLALMDSVTLPGPEVGALYPDTAFGADLRNAAALIKVDVGVEVIMVELDGFDHHSQQGPLDGDLADLLDELARGLAALRTDLASHWHRVTVMAHSEFGRRVAENASGGADHGHGGLMIAMGGNVAGGKVHGSWPGLAPSQLDDGDLAVTTDYRDLLGEVLANRFGASHLGAVFPNHLFQPPGVVS